MKKINPQNYKGIKFITLDNLPEQQRELFYEWIDKNHLISIQIKNSILRDCVQFSDYDYWFENILFQNKNTQTPQDTNKFRRFIKLALSK